MGHARALLAGDSRTLTSDVPEPGIAGLAPIPDGTSLGVIVSDVLYVALTIVVFAVLLLILRGVERFER
jgi:hypothetical protein